MPKNYWMAVRGRDRYCERVSAEYWIFAAERRDPASCAGGGAEAQADHLLSGGMRNVVAEPADVIGAE